MRLFPHNNVDRSNSLPRTEGGETTPEGELVRPRLMCSLVLPWKLFVGHRDACYHGCTLFDLLVECRGSDRGNPRLTAVLPWVLLRATVASRGFPRQGPRVSIVHGASTASVMVVPMAHSVVVSMATAVELAMATHGSTTAIATACSIATSTAIAAAIHGNQRHSMAIATAFHGNCRGNPPQLPRQFPRQLQLGLHIDRHHGATSS